MSREAYEAVITDYETFDPREAYADEICLFEVSKLLRGRFALHEHEVQGCDQPSCKTLKQAGVFEAVLEPGPCDSEESAPLSGQMEGYFVAAYKDADTTNRGGHTGSLQWSGGGSELVGRLRGVVNAGTHYSPLEACETCYTLNHVEGWLRAAVVGGKHDGCRVAATYALRLDTSGGFEGTLEGLLICQCR